MSELTENSTRVFAIIVFTILLALFILVTAKFYQRSTQQIQPSKTEINLTGNNFPTIQLGHYALWGVSEQNAFTLIKRFNFVDGSLVSLDGSVLESVEIDDATYIKSIAVTIELEGDRDEIPSELILMSQSVNDNKADLSFDVEEPTEESTFLLATPTDGNNTINELSGLWFISEDLITKSLSLDEPVNPFFTYEARIINNEFDEEINIGRFTDTNSSDDFQNHSLTNPGYNTPGEDFLRNLPVNIEPPINLTNGEYQVIISIEPDIDGTDISGPEVFLEIYNTEIPQTLNAYKSFPLDFTFKPITLKVVIDE